MLASPRPERLEIYRSANFGIFLAQPSYNAGHLWIIPQQHLPHFAALSAMLHLELQQLTIKAMQALQVTVEPHGFNVGFNQFNEMAEHFCLQIVPRWQGDANLSFAGANTKAVGILVPNLVEQLKGSFNA
jgi:ATP adenylyltransferase